MDEQKQEKRIGVQKGLNSPTDSIISFNEPLKPKIEVGSLDDNYEDLVDYFSQGLQ